MDRKAVIQQWYARRDGLPVPFESFIMLAISVYRAREKTKVEFVRYEKKKLHEALNYLMHKIFEDRLYPVNVKLLTVNGDIIRLTPGLRIKVEEMEITSEMGLTLDGMEPYIEESSFPLKWLKCFVLDDINMFQHPKLRSAKHLVIAGCPDPVDWLPIFLGLENHKFEMNGERQEANVPVNVFMQLIKKWVSGGKQVGASFRYSLDVDKVAELEMDDFHKQIFKRIKKQFKSCVTGRRCAKIPTDDGTTLKVSVERSDDDEEPWNLVLEILPMEQ